MLTKPQLAKLIAATLLLALAGIGLAHAQSPLGIGSAEPSFSVSGPFGGFFAWINGHQQAFYRALTGALREMRTNPWALTTLIGLSFAYGVFHAAGPGHGKAVISSYMIANETELKRGMLISLISALLQGVVAIALVAAAFFVLRGTSITMTRATQAMEVASYVMIILFGGWLLLRKLRSLKFRKAAVVTPASSSAPAMSLPRGRIGGGMPKNLSFQAIAIDDDAHAYQGKGEICDTCGNAHAPDPAMLRGQNFSLHEAWSAIIAVGLRPCSGALLVMSFSFLNGLYLGGVLSVLAMSIGTAITVSLLAIVAVTAKDLAVRFAGEGSSTAMRVATVIEILGALLVILMGMVLLGAALQS
jgi:ABC-type nickel/cobalt efflux system permease component RcnA